MDRNQHKELDKRLDNLVENYINVKKRANEEICRYGGISSELLVNEVAGKIRKQCFWEKGREMCFPLMCPKKGK